MADEFNQYDQTQQWQDTSQQQYAQPQYQQAPQQQYAQPQYQQPAQPYTYMDPRKPDPVSFGNWMLTIFLTMIPIVNIIMYFVWSFGSSTEKSKSNWAKASLVWMLIGIVLSIIISVVAAIAGVSLVDYAQANGSL